MKALTECVNVTLVESLENGKADNCGQELGVIVRGCVSLWNMSPIGINDGLQFDQNYVCKAVIGQFVF